MSLPRSTTTSLLLYPGLSLPSCLPNPFPAVSVPRSLPMLFLPLLGNCLTLPSCLRPHPLLFPFVDLPSCLALSMLCPCLSPTSCPSPHSLLWTCLALPSCLTLSLLCPCLALRKLSLSFNPCCVPASHYQSYLSLSLLCPWLALLMLALSPCSVDARPILSFSQLRMGVWSKIHIAIYIAASCDNDIYHNIKIIN